MKNISKFRGFTLVELMVVVGIISILTAIITANFTESKKRSRDAKRISDIAQIQLALELGFDKCNAYPASLSTSASICTGHTLGDFISTIPTDSGTAYTYATSGSVDYVLRATLETNSSVLTDAPTGTIFGVSCDHSSTYYYCVRPN